MLEISKWVDNTSFFRMNSSLYRIIYSCTALSSYCEYFGFAIKSWLLFCDWVVYLVSTHAPSVSKEVRSV
jgi:hypothetical protein